MAVYDDQQTRPDKKELDDLNSLTGITPQEEGAMESSAYSGAAEDIAEREKLNSKTMEAPGGNESSGDEIPFTGGNSQKKKDFRVTKKQGIAAGGITGLLVGGGLLATIATGPLQIIHFGKLLSGFHFGSSAILQNNRSGKLIRYARTIDSPEKRNLGLIGEKFASHYNKKLISLGLETSFTTSSGGRSRFMQGFSFDPKTPQGRNVLGSLQANGVEIPSTAIDGKVHLDFDSLGRKSSKQVTYAMVDTLNLNKVSSTVSKRLLIRRARINLTPLTGLKRKSNETRVDFRQKIKDKFNKSRRLGKATGASPSIRANDVDVDGNKIDINSDGERIVAEGEDAIKTSKSSEPKARRVSGMKAKLAGGAGVVGVLCAIKSVGDSAQELKHLNIVLPLMRTGMDMVAMSSQIMTGHNVTMDELSVISEDLYDIHSKTSWASARSIQAELGQELTGPDIPPTANPGKIGEKPVFFKWVDNAFSSTMGLGSAACSSIGQFVLGAITPIQTLVSEGILAVSRAAIGRDPIEMIASWAVSALAGEEVDTEAAGAALGNIANYGARLAANDAAIAAGGVPLSSLEIAELNQERRDLERRDFRQKGLFVRLFDPYEPKSLLASTVLQNPSFASMAGMSNSVTQLPIKGLGFFGDLLSKSFTRTYAADTSSTYDYGIPLFGFPLSDADDPRVEDPYENAEWVNSYGLDILNNRYGKCFSTTVDPESFSLRSADSPKYEDITTGVCTDDRDKEEFLRYRFFLLDTITAKSLSCYEGLDEGDCTEMGFGGQVSTEVPIGTSPSVAVVGNTADTPCAPGTNDVGTETGYRGGQAYTIRLCAIPGFISGNEEGNGNLVRVNSTVSGNWLSLYQRANAQGVNLRAHGSFRSMDRQTYFWNCYVSKSCNGGILAAKPGTSNHQMGFSVDIVMDGSKLSVARCIAGKDRYPIYSFLASNAPKFGISADVSSECWHWTAK